MGSDELKAIRPLHFLEQYSAARHHLHIYHCVINTARYERTSPQQEDRPHPVYNALITLVRRHGILRVGIADEGTKQPFFCHVPKVDLRNQVEFRTLKCSSPEDYDMKLAELQALHHSQAFEGLARIPPWRLIVVTPDIDGSSPGTNMEDFMFVFHHSLFDGHSSKLFHEQLVASLNYPSCSIDTDAEQTYELEFPAKPALPPPREEVIPSHLTAGFIAGVLWKEKGPRWLQPSSDPIWAGKDINFGLPFVTKMLPVDIPSATLTRLLKGCRANSTTLTGLLHALILASLARRVDPSDARSFRSTTPMNYRLLDMDNVQKAWSDDTLANAVTASYEEHPALDVSAFRASGSDTDALIWSNARRIGAVLEKRRSTLPVNDEAMLLKFAGNMFTFFKQKDGRPRDASWELSNIGVMKGVPFDDEDHSSWRITRAFFSNSAMVAGQALSVNVASVSGGSLTMSVVWQEGIVPEEIMKGLASDLLAFTSKYEIEETFVGKTIG